MKKEYRSLIIGSVAGAVLLLALAGILIYRAPVRLGRRYQELLSSSFTGQLRLDGADPLQMQLSDPEVRKILHECKVTRAVRECADEAGSILVETVGEPQICIEACRDGHVFVTTDRNGEPEESFWKDDGELFEALYDCHLRNAGVDPS